MKIETIRCKTADEFMAQLRPSNHIWDGALNGWVFRGQRDSSWGLVPSVFRIDPKKWPMCKEALCNDINDQIKQELNLLRVFA